MLRELVPSGRTHRLSVVIAGMLHYATCLAERLDQDELEEDSVALSLINANEMDTDQLKDELHDVIEELKRRIEKNKKDGKETKELEEFLDNIGCIFRFIFCGERCTVAEIFSGEKIMK